MSRLIVRIRHLRREHVDMKTKELESLLRDGAIANAELSQNREVLKNTLTGLHHHLRPGHPMRIWIVPGILLGCLCVTTAFFLMIDDNNHPGPSNNLGGVWCTFSDSASGGTSTVWPPASSSCENLFVKSAPGYGDIGYAVRIRGTAGTADNAYLGVMTYLSEKAACPRCIGIDLSIYRGIRFKMKGKLGKGKLLFILPYESNRASENHNTCMTLSGYNDYQADITDMVGSDWTDVRLHFRKDFRRPAKVPAYQKLAIETVLGDEKSIKWKWCGEPGQKIDLWIDEVELF